MRFICDVHIPYKLSKRLSALGFEAFHVNDLLHRWHTRDQEISQYADLHDLILITKDRDFKNSFFVQRTPRKLIKISLGNLSNDDLIRAVCKHLKAIQTLNKRERFLLEIDRDYVVFTKE